MRINVGGLCRRAAIAFVLLNASQPVVHAADKQRKAKETEAKRLISLGRLRRSRAACSTPERSIWPPSTCCSPRDAEKGLERIAEAADEQVKTLMADAAQAYAAENFAKAAQLLESAGALHPGNLAIGCNLALTRYQQGNRDEALDAARSMCRGAARQGPAAPIGGAVHGPGHRRPAERRGARRPGSRSRDSTTRSCRRVTRTPQSDDDDDGCADAPAVGALRADEAVAGRAARESGDALQPRQVRRVGGTPRRRDPSADRIQPGCAEGRGQRRGAGATGGVERPVRAAGSEGVAGPDPLHERRESTWRRAEYDLAIADYQKADEAIPEFARKQAPGRDASGGAGADRSRADVLAAGGPRRHDRRKPAADAAHRRRTGRGERRSTTSWSARPGSCCTIWWDAACSRGNRSAGSTRRTGCSSPTRRSSPPTFLLPLASEGNLLQAFTCSQMNDFRCVRASFDAQRSLTLPVSFYGAVFYKGVEPKKRAKQARTYGKFEFEKGTLRFAEISTVNPKKQDRDARPSPVAGEDRLGRLGAADGLRAAGFQGFTVPASAIKHLETQRRHPVPGGGRQAHQASQDADRAAEFRARRPSHGPGRAALHEQLHQHRGNLRRRREGQAREGVHDGRREAEDGLQHRDRSGST